jgi:hypothetical protein
MSFSSAAKCRRFESANIPAHSKGAMSLAIADLGRGTARYSYFGFFGHHRPCGLDVAFALALFRTVMVWSAARSGFSGYFFVLGQINRHGWVLIVSLNSFTFSPTGSKLRMVILSFSDESRKF